MTPAVYVAALRRERAGYLAAGKVERARQVNAELKRFGVEDEPETVVDPYRANVAVDDDTPEAAVGGPPERAVRPRGRPRKSGA